MEPLLTLLIAPGGIATGIGASWTAMVTRNLARATERSLAEQSESFRKQNEHAREQNKRARINLEVDLMQRLGGQGEIPRPLHQLREFGRFACAFSLRSRCCHWVRPDRPSLHYQTARQGRCSSYRGGHRPGCRHLW